MSIKVQVSYEQAVLALKKAVAEKGENYVYQRLSKANGVGHCVYFNADRSPSCLVGHVLADAGLEPLEYTSIANSTAISRLETLGVVEFADRDLNGRSRTLDLLLATQSRQDCSWPWGEAVKESLEYVQNRDRLGY